ncbi:SCO family protein [Flavicella sediminum]|uniref:SCO family protein n=1 Tax=Flavicella sediminum TaxID=2585141 RepID=UPI001FB5E828|nr:SCO family protein [Flavicella sediminum]
MKIYISLLLLVFSFSACQNKKTKTNEIVYQCPMKCEGEKTFAQKGICQVCKMNLQALSKRIEQTTEISESSIFNLSSSWTTEEGKVIQLATLKGKPLVLVMIYTSCKAACPRLVADMRNIEAQIEKNEALNYVLVSIDPENDTPERLKAFAIENKMDAEHWIFLQGSVSGVREFANVLAVKYKQISPIDFSHSNIISVFNAKGELVHQQEGLGVDNKSTIAKISELTASL